MNDQQRHHRAAHCMQAGIKLDYARRGFLDEDEHITARVGINMSLRDLGSLTMLLVKKGVITEAEYWKALADGMETEVKQLEEQLTKAYGGKSKITLVGALGSIHDAEIVP